jgi:MFS family permease
MTPCAIALGFVQDATTAIVVMSLAVFFSAFQGGIAGGTLQLMTPNRMRGQMIAAYLLVATLIGLGFGPTVIAATTDFVFGYDEAIGKSIALCAGILCPAGALILWFGLSHIRHEIEIQNEAALAEQPASA